LDPAKKKPAYRALFNAELASTKAVKLTGPLSEGAGIGSTVVEVNENAGNRSAKGTRDPCENKKDPPSNQDGQDET
jgi:hypothetical protein